jgi:signal transduction histidine kinase/DNA-binding response OmpR family regulator
MPRTDNHILLLFSNTQVEQLLERVLTLSGFVTTNASDKEGVEKLVRAFTPDLILIGEKVGARSGVDMVIELQHSMPVTPIIMFVERDGAEIMRKAVRAGVVDCLSLPIRSEEFIKIVEYHLERARVQREYLLLETRRATTSLQRRLDELETLTQLGQSIISSLELDKIFIDVVKAAVSLTGAEEGSLMLVDEESDELYMRAALNFNDHFVHTFRLKVSDSLAGLVMRRGEPVLLDERSPQKISTAYLVKNLIYVPLRLTERIIGVLGVDNRTTRPPFKDHDRKLLEALAEYTAIAIHNAGLYANTINQRNQLETTLTHIQDGVVLVDKDRRLMLVNQVAEHLFDLNNDCLGKSFDEVFSHHKELGKLFERDAIDYPGWVEMVNARDEVFSAHLADIPDVGQVITLHDITPLKKLDRIKSDFVSTVSHDLRSPLTAILGYVDLLERAGPLNDMQRDFVRRVKVSAHNITGLVDDLLDLGRIEAGLDMHKDKVALNTLVQESLEIFKGVAADKNQKVEMELADPPPVILATELQIRQMIDNLLENAFKYTPDGGVVKLSTETADGQAILKVSDSGMGIPANDLPHVFEKFYRASNVTGDMIGTGLGLSIVRSVAELHNGRVWAESPQGKGTTFFVVLPLCTSA